MTEQSQRSGANSKQLQVHGDFYNITTGVDEERAAQIADQRARQVLEEYSSEAARIAEERISALSEKVITVLKGDGLLSQLAEPAFQVQLKRAQIAAASTERDEDYEVLASLLSQRARGDSRIVRAAVSRAVDVIDALDDRALNGLTALWVVQTFTPIVGSPSAALNAIDQLYKDLEVGDLPVGTAWIEHLDMLDLVRPARHGIATLKPFVQYFSQRSPGYFVEGFDDSLEAELMVAMISQGLPTLEIVPHALRPNQIPPLKRFNYASLNALKDALANAPTEPAVQEQLLEVAKRGGIETVSDTTMPRLNEEIDKLDSLKAVRDWWDQISSALTFTSAGIALAHANWARNPSHTRPAPLEGYLGAAGAS